MVGQPLAPARPRRSRLRSLGSGRWLPVALGLASPLLVLWFIASHGVDVPRLDDWSLATVLRCGDEGGCLTWANIGRQHVESRPVTSRLLVLALAPVVGFDVRSLMFTSLALVAFASLLLLCMGRASLPESSTRHLWLWAAANAGVFGIAQAETWLHGAHVGTYLVIATLCGGLALASSSAPLGARVVGGFGIATAASFSMTSGLMSWVLLPAVWAIRCPRQQLGRWLGLWAVGSAAALTLYFWGFEDRSPGSWGALREPHRALGYTLVFLGAPFGRAFGEQGSRILLLSGVFGALLVAAAAWSIGTLVRARDGHRWRRASPWVALALFACGTAGMAALGRLAYGMDQALSPKYTAWSIYLPVALLFLVPVAFEGRRRVVSAGAALAALGLCLHAVTSWHVLAQADTVRREQLRLRASLDFAHVVPDRDRLRQLFPWPDRLLARSAFLNGHDLLGRSLAPSDRVLEIASSRASVPAAGSIERYRLDSGGLLLRGWAVLPERGEPAHAVLLCAEVPGRESGGPRVVAVVSTGQPRPELARASARAATGRSGWNHRFDVSRLREGESLLTAWAYDSISGRAVRLGGEIRVDSAR